MSDTMAKYKVLLVEDDDRLAQLVSEYLGNYEFVVEVAGSVQRRAARGRDGKPVPGSACGKNLFRWPGRRRRTALCGKPGLPGCRRASAARLVSPYTRAPS